jgi:hypothetical protein
LPFDLCHLNFDLLFGDAQVKWQMQKANGKIRFLCGAVMNKPNGVASANDFRKLAEGSAFEEPSRVVLPKSGYGVVLRRPTKFYWALRRTGWPRELREKLDLVGVGVKPELTADETLLLVRED